MAAISQKVQENDESHKAMFKSLEVKIGALEELIKLNEAPAPKTPIRKESFVEKANESKIMPQLQQAVKNLIRRHSDTKFSEEEAKKLMLQEIRKELNDEKLTERIKTLADEQFAQITQKVGQSKVQFKKNEEIQNKITHVDEELHQAIDTFGSQINALKSKTKELVMKQSDTVRSQQETERLNQKMSLKLKQFEKREADIAKVIEQLEEKQNVSVTEILNVIREIHSDVNKNTISHEELESLKKEVQALEAQI